MATKQNRSPSTPKYVLALSFFIHRSMNKLEALNLYGDTCLNTTVSILAKEHGVRFIKRLEPHINQAGGLVHFKRYSLADESKERAYELIKPFMGS